MANPALMPDAARQLAVLADDVRVVIDSAVFGLQTDGAHHKQWYLERICRLLGVDLEAIEHEPGIAP